MRPPDPETRLAALRAAALGWPAPTKDSPWVVLFSGCLAGLPVGVNGTDYGPHTLMRRILPLPNVRPVPFCPEDRALGTPRGMPDLHDGDGFDAHEGRARMVLDDGKDVTAPMLVAAREMAEFALLARPRFALLMDMSAACGTQAISLGARGVPVRQFQAGFGVAAAALWNAGIPCVAQRDLFTLGALLKVLDPLGPPVEGDGLDHHQREWYRQTFG